MGERELFKGNEAVAEAAIRGGCRYFFGYPITPQNEIPEYMSRRLPELNGAFVQAESEVSAINMLYGAAGAGARAMTSSSSPGISLKQEGISYLAGAEIPCLIVNMVRGGPGLGGIQPAQSDYFQSVKGGGHGDYKLIVYTPASVQEMVDIVSSSFDVAEKYRTPVLILGDGILGQMMEPVTFPEMGALDNKDKEWATNGTQMKRDHRVVNSLYLVADKCFDHNLKLAKKFELIKKNETKYEAYNLDGAETVLVAYGSTARICRSVVDKANAAGMKIGMIRPITISPFPEEVISNAANTAKRFLTVEMSMGQMVEDVKLAVNGKVPVHFHGTTGGIVPTATSIYDKLIEIAKEGK